MGLLLTLIAGLVIWIVLWATGTKSLDAFLIPLLMVVIAAGGADARAVSARAARRRGFLAAPANSHGCAVPLRFRQGRRALAVACAANGRA